MIVRDDNLVESLKRNFKGAELVERERVGLAYAEKLAVRPSEVSRDDIEHLQAVGFSDEQILDIILITGYFSYLNRLADALGVERDVRITSPHT
ncbi:MAG: peroxidase [Acidobacteria bacterium]|nr:peroxidase [Acidobacteriota bacterium]